MLNWEKFGQAPSKRFEIFLYTLVDRAYGNSGRLTDFDDSGGGDGIEFYLQLQNGEEWGWQAKYFYPDKRLRISNRYKQISDSFMTAVEKHPHLKKLILCTPEQLTTEEISKVSLKFQEIIASTREIKLEFWNKNKYISLMTKPEMIGLRSEFFGELELSLKFCKYYFDRIKANIGQVYKKELHIETNAEKRIMSLLFPKKFIKDLHFFKEMLEKLLFPDLEIEPQILHFENEKTTFEVKTKDILDELKQFYDQLKQSVQDIEENRIFFFDFNSSYDFWISLKAIKRIYNQNPKEDMLGLRIVVNNIANNYEALKSEYENKNQRIITIFGPSGYGKTELCCHIIEESLTMGTPSFLFLGKHFSPSTPWQIQILQILDLRINSWTDFIAATKWASQTYKRPILIVIDGLLDGAYNNESPIFLSNFIPDLLKCIEDNAHLFLIITCKVDDKQKIWSGISKKSRNEIQLFGFEDLTKKAISHYFDYFNIKFQLTPLAIEILKIPIFLRVFCESYSSSGKKDIKVSENSPGIHEFLLKNMYTIYIKQLDEKICRKFGERAGTGFLKNILFLISEFFWINKRRDIPFDTFRNYCDSKKGYIEWERSIAKSLLEEGLLFNKNSLSEEEKVEFIFDSFAGFIISMWLCEKHKISSIFSLFKKNFSQYPFYPDIIPYVTIYLIDYQQPSKFFYSKRMTNVNLLYAILQIPSFYYKKEFVHILDQRWDIIINNEKLLRLLLGKASDPNSQLNAHFFTQNISKMSLTKRDSVWSEFVIKNIDLFEAYIRDFADLLHQDFISNEQKSMLNLKLQILVWTLTVPDKRLQRQTIECLFDYGLNYPVEFFDTFTNNIELNDKSIIEGLISILYGIVVCYFHTPPIGSKDSLLIKWAQDLYSRFFSTEKPSITTNLIVRYFARQIIHLVIFRKNNVLKREEIKQIDSPYGGKIEKDLPSKFLIKIVKQNKFPLGFAFYLIKLKSLLISTEITQENSNILIQFYWKFLLHYTSKKITIQDRIKKYLQMKNIVKISIPDTRYCKKYARSAYYEVLGLYENKKEIKEFQIREIFDLPIDPTFPEKMERFQRKFVLFEKFDPKNIWTLQNSLSDIVKIIIRKQINGIEGPWILIGGNINQIGQGKQTQEVNLYISSISYGYEKKYKSKSEIFENLQGNFVELFPPPTNIAFGGEIPWHPEFVPPKDLECLYPNFIYLSNTFLQFPVNGKRMNFLIAPSKKLCNTLGIIRKERKWEFIDNMRNICVQSLLIKYKGRNIGNLCYIKKDSLTQFLKQTKGDFVQILSSETGIIFKLETMDFITFKSTQEMGTFNPEILNSLMYQNQGSPVKSETNFDKIPDQKNDPLHRNIGFIFNGHLLSSRNALVDAFTPLKSPIEWQNFISDLHKSSDLQNIENWSNSTNFKIRQEIAKMKNLPLKILEKLSRDKYSFIRMLIATNSSTPNSILKEMIYDDDLDVKTALYLNSNVDENSKLIISGTPGFAEFAIKKFSEIKKEIHRQENIERELKKFQEAVKSKTEHHLLTVM